MGNIKKRLFYLGLLCFGEEAGTLGLKYTSFISILTQAVQEFDAALKESQQTQKEQLNSKSCCLKL